MDFKILLYIQENIKNDFFDFLMPIISFLSNSGWIWILSAVLLCISKKTRKYGFALALGAFLCFIFGNVLLKPLIARVRPYDAYSNFELIINKLHDFSFPSGHTYSAFCGATILLYVNKKLGYAALVLAILTAFSRIYLFVHYPSDVLAGMIMGVSIALFSVFCIEHLTIYRKRSNKNKVPE